MELSFEYLMAKNSLKWITIASEQAMLMSVCLQCMVDELLNQKDGNDLNNIQVSLDCFDLIVYRIFLFIYAKIYLQLHSSNQPMFSYIRRDGRRISESSSTDTISSLVSL